MTINKTPITTRRCSVCKDIMGAERKHNIRTCVNKAFLGKSKFKVWTEGPYKLFHIAGKKAEELSQGYNIFTFKGWEYYDDQLAILNDDVSEYQHSL